jgi:hypothetical protein
MRNLLLPGLLSLVLVSSASAQVTNGSFNSGLAGWTSAATGFGSVAADPYGNPNNSARITTTNALFSPPAGSGSISQTFGCGSSFETGLCMISLEYQANTFNGAVARFAIEIDGNEVYSFDHSISTSGFIPVTVSAPCGLHTIKLTGSNVSGGTFSGWAFWIDNVSAQCETPIPSRGSTWGGVKALYE